jgi:hypothetical protein
MRKPSAACQPETRPGCSSVSTLRRASCVLVFSARPCEAGQYYDGHASVLDGGDHILACDERDHHTSRSRQDGHGRWRELRGGGGRCQRADCNPRAGAWLQVLWAPTVFYPEQFKDIDIRQVTRSVSRPERAPGCPIAIRSRCRQWMCCGAGSRGACQTAHGFARMLSRWRLQQATSVLAFTRGELAD